MTGVHEPGLEAASHAVDDGAALRAVTALEGEQVDLEDLTHWCTDPEIEASGSAAVHQ